MGQYGHKWTRIVSHMSRRTAQECEARWNDLNAMMLMDGGDEKSLVVPQPKWWDEWPLLPFMKIFSHLDYEHVIGKLPLVCQHFNQLLSKNAVAFEKLVLRFPTAQQLIKLKEEVSICKSLDLSVMDQLDDDTTLILSKLLDKFKHSFVELNFSWYFYSDGQSVIT
jgi:hypothetical protein